MARGRNEVKESMDTVVSESRVTLDPRFLSENIVILTFEVTDNFLEAAQEMMSD